ADTLDLGQRWGLRATGDEEQTSDLGPAHGERECLGRRRDRLRHRQSVGLRREGLGPAAQWTRIREAEGAAGRALEVVPLLTRLDERDPALGSQDRSGEAGEASARSQAA